MRKIVFIITFLSFVACKVEKPAITNVNGIWIPEKINWEDGNFNTFFIYNDTSFLMLSSTQKLINDSIFFQAEPGFVLKQGTKISIDSSKAKIGSRVLYRFITLPGDTTPSALIHEILYLKTKGINVVSFNYNGLKYIRTSKYTSQSLCTIRNLASKMVPDLKNEYGIK